MEKGHLRGTQQPVAAGFDEEEKQRGQARVGQEAGNDKEMESLQVVPENCQHPHF